MLCKVSHRSQFGSIAPVLQSRNSDFWSVGIQVYSNFSGPCGGSERPDLNLCEGGYLFLLYRQPGADSPPEPCDAKGTRCDVRILESRRTPGSLPHLRVHDLQLASYGRSGEGCFQYGVEHGFRTRPAPRASCRVGEVVESAVKETA